MNASPPTLTRAERLLAFDGQYQNTDQSVWVIGTDEVGRGSCIGPVVAGATVTPYHLPTDFKDKLAELNDSKQLSARQREYLYQTLIDARQGNPPIIASALGEASQHEVDTLNVYQASLLAIHRALEHLLKTNLWLSDQRIVLLLDGKAVLPKQWLPSKCVNLTQHAIIKGDGKSFAIAAASVLAKHYRDSLLSQWAREYPQYGWDTNMGYPTPAHKQALLEHGPTHRHRTQYKAVQEALYARQQSLF